MRELRVFRDFLGARLAKASSLVHIGRMGRTAVILIHEQTEGPGLLDGALRASGFEPLQRYRRVGPGDESAPLVVAMGGPMAVYEAQRHPFLVEEIALLKARLDDGRPCLGICFGAQLLAAAAGAKVRHGESGLELGVFPVSLTSEAASDPVFGELAATTSFAHWHRDTFDAVPGAVRLALTERYSQQAFKLGPSYGLQFHPELDAMTLERWLHQSPEDVEESGRPLEQIIDTDLPRLRISQSSAEQLLARLARHFAQCCSAREQSVG